MTSRRNFCKLALFALIATTVNSHAIFELVCFSDNKDMKNQNCQAVACSDEGYIQIPESVKRPRYWTFKLVNEVPPIEPRRNFPK